MISQHNHLLTCQVSAVTPARHEGSLPMQARSVTVQWTRGQSMGAMCCCCPLSTLQAAWHAAITLGLKCSATCLPSRPVLPPRCPPVALQCCPSTLPFNAALEATFLPCLCPPFTSIQLPLMPSKLRLTCELHCCAVLISGLSERLATPSS